MKLVSQRDICTPLFIAVLVTIAKMWKQPLKVHQWMNGLSRCGVHTREYDLALKRLKSCHFPYKHKPGGYYTTWNKPDTEQKNTTWSHFHVESLKVSHIEAESRTVFFRCLVLITSCQGGGSHVCLLFISHFEHLELPVCSENFDWGVYSFFCFGITFF